MSHKPNLAVHDCSTRKILMMCALANVHRIATVMDIHVAVHSGLLLFSDVNTILTKQGIGTTATIGKAV